MSQHVFLDNYSSAADIVVSAICLVMIILVSTSYIERSRSSTLFLSMVGLVLAAAWSDIGFYEVALSGHLIAANWLRCFYHAMLFLIFVHYIAYICEVTRYEKTRTYVILANVIFAAVLLADVFNTARGLTFAVTATGIQFIRHGLFFCGYLAFLVLSLVLLAKVRNLLFRRLMIGFYGTLAVSMMVLVMQGLAGQSSFTVASLMFPVIAMMYMLHSNPYDATLGTNDAGVMSDLVRYYHRKKKEFVFISLYMKDFEEGGRKLPDEVKELIRQFSYRYFRRAKVFSVSRGHVIVVFPKRQNADAEERFEELLNEFYRIHEQYRYDYKLVIGEGISEISKTGDYASYFRSIHRTMPECSVRRVGEDEVNAFRQSEYILKELADIHRKGNPDDPRVLAFAQPVLDTRTGNCNTAEALMRLDLAETGIITPDRFIPLAEERGYIHTLTRIILHKVCEAIREFTEEDCGIERISVNVSVQELKDKNFCRDILDIIRRSGVRGDRIAFELTETKSESDFMLMKEKIAELKGHGIKFYLDDFGTGYSNMERIMELPFDIIKFDRSLVQAAGTDDRSRIMVSNLANMFADMDYAVLYEGIETESDETMCRDMSAAYLQGFRYARPAPIERTIGN